MQKTTYRINKQQSPTESRGNCTQYPVEKHNGKEHEKECIYMGLPWWLSGKACTCQCRRRGFYPWPGKMPHAAEQLNQCSTPRAPVLQSLGSTNGKPAHFRARALQQEKPLQWEASRLQLESGPLLLQLEKSPCNNEDAAQPKTIVKNFIKECICVCVCV